MTANRPHTILPGRGGPGGIPAGGIPAGRKPGCCCCGWPPGPIIGAIPAAAAGTYLLQGTALTSGAHHCSMICTSATHLEAGRKVPVACHSPGQGAVQTWIEERRLRLPGGVLIWGCGVLKGCLVHYGIATAKSPGKAIAKSLGIFSRWDSKQSRTLCLVLLACSPCPPKTRGMQRIHSW